MKNEHIRNTFDCLSPSKEQKESMYLAIVNRQSRKEGKHGKRLRIVFAAAAGIAAIAAGVLLTDGFGDIKGTAIVSAAAEPSGQSDTPASGVSLPEVQQAYAFSGFVLTVYQADSMTAYLGADFAETSDKQVLAPDVEVLLAKYSLAMSSVPGLPFTVDIAGTDDITEIRISADHGELIEWNRDTGIVSSQGKLMATGAGGTAYWSPVSDMAANTTITVEAMNGDTVLGRQRIYITQDEKGFFYATADEPDIL